MNKKNGYIQIRTKFDGLSLVLQVVTGLAVLFLFIMITDYKYPLEIAEKRHGALTVVGFAALGITTYSYLLILLFLTLFHILPIVLIRRGMLTGYPTISLRLAISVIEILLAIILFAVVMCGIINTFSLVTP